MTPDMWIELAPVLIAVGGTLLGAIIGAFGAIMSARLRAGRARREEQVSILADQVTAYFHLTEAMAEGLSGTTDGTAARTIKKNFRDQIGKEKGVRPDMSPSEVDRLLSRKKRGN